MEQQKQVIAAVSGTLLQWYDFSLFGFLAPIISKTFFPGHNAFIALLSTFAVFAVGYLLAPLGALFFGVIGDRYGRKRALLLSVTLMTIPTFLIAILPGFDRIGIWAPLILLLCRMLQGFVASAEFAGSVIFLVEHAPKTRRAFYSCLTSCAYSVGMMLGAAVCGLLTQSHWGAHAWRFAFALSALGAVVVLWFRQYLKETPAFSQSIPLSVTALCRGLMQFPRAVTATLAISWYAGVMTFSVYVYAVTYMHQYGHIGLALAARYVSYALLVDIIVEPFAAILADKWGRKKVMLAGLLMMLVALPLLLPMLAGPSHQRILMGLLALSFLIAISCAPSNALMTMLYPVQQRFSAFAFSFNIGISVFGGTAPLILAYSTHHFGVVAMTWYLCLATIMGFAGVFFSKAERIA